MGFTSKANYKTLLIISIFLAASFLTISISYAAPGNSNTFPGSPHPTDLFGCPTMKSSKCTCSSEVKIISKEELRKLLRQKILQKYIEKAEIETNLAALEEGYRNVNTEHDKAFEKWYTYNSLLSRFRHSDIMPYDNLNFDSQLLQFANDPSFDAIMEQAFNVNTLGGELGINGGYKEAIKLSIVSSVFENYKSGMSPNDANYIQQQLVNYRSDLQKVFDNVDTTVRSRDQMSLAVSKLNNYMKNLDNTALDTIDSTSVSNQAISGTKDEITSINKNGIKAEMDKNFATKTDSTIDFLKTIVKGIKDGNINEKFNEKFGKLRKDLSKAVKNNEKTWRDKTDNLQKRLDELKKAIKEDREDLARVNAEIHGLQNELLFLKDDKSVSYKITCKDDEYLRDKEHPDDSFDISTGYSQYVFDQQSAIKNASSLVRIPLMFNSYMRYAAAKNKTDVLEALNIYNQQSSISTLDEKKIYLDYWNPDSIYKATIFSPINNLVQLSNETDINKMNTIIENQLLYMNSLQSISSTPNIAVLRSGYQSAVVNILGSIYEPVGLIDRDNLDSLSLYDTLIIPSGALVNNNDPFFNTKLKDYVENGGIIIVFSQVHGYDYNVLPSGENIAGYGYAEDVLCQENSITLSEYNPILSSLNLSGNQPKLSINVDGYFTKWPDNAAILLKRTKNSMPVAISYTYGKGTVIATGLYDDYAFQQHSSTVQGIDLIKNIASWAKYPDMTTQNIVFNTQSSLQLNITNHAITNTTSIVIDVVDPDRAVESFTFNQEISRNEKETKTINLTYTPKKRGFYYIDYRLLDANGNIIEYKSDAFRFTSTDIFKTDFGYSKASDLIFAVQSSSDKYPAGGTAKFDIKIWNKADRERTIDINWEWIHNGKNRLGTFTLKPNETITIPYVYENIPDSGIWRFWVFFYENGQHIGTDSIGGSVFKPAVSLSIDAEKSEYKYNDQVKYTTKAANLRPTAYNATIKVKALNPNNQLIYSNSFIVEMKPSVTNNITDMFTIPEGSAIGTYQLIADAYDEKTGVQRIGSNSFVFEIPSAYTLSLKSDKPGFVYRIRDSALLTLELGNSVQTLINSSYNISIPDLSFLVEKKINLKLGEVSTETFSLPIPTNLQPGKHQISIKIVYDNRTKLYNFFIPESLIDAEFPKDSYNIGEIVSTKVKNIGGVDTDAVCLLRLYDKNTITAYSLDTTKTILAGSSQSINFTVPNLADGSYSLVLSCQNMRTNAISSFTKSLSIAGVKASLDLSTSKKIYRPTEAVSALSKISSAALTNAKLELKVEGVSSGSSNFAEAWKAGGNSYSSLNNPVKLAVDRLGNIYVADWTTRKIHKFDKDGNFITAFNPYDENNNPYLSRPYGLEIVGDKLYVADYDRSYVRVFDLDLDISSRYVDGKFSQAMKFNSGNYIEVKNSPSVSITGPITVEAWVNPSRFNSYNPIFSTNSFGIERYSSGGLAFWLNDGTSWKEAHSSGDIPLNKWTHVVGVYNGTNIKVYINGVQSGTTTVSASPTSITSPIFIGHHLTEDGSGRWWYGSIDEVNIYNRALTPAEILSRNSSLASIPGNVLSLHLDNPEVSSLEIKDSSSLNTAYYRGATYNMSFDQTNMDRPRAIKYYNGIFFVSNNEWRINEFNSSGNWIGEIREGNNGFKGPQSSEAIAFDSNGNMYIADNVFKQDERRGGIYIYSNNMQKLASIQQNGSEQGAFGSSSWTGPQGVEVDNKEYVYTLDRVNCRIQKFSLDKVLEKQKVVDSSSFANSGTNYGGFYRNGKFNNSFEFRYSGDQGGSYVIVDNKEIKDSSENSNNGYNIRATYTDGKFGDALSFSNNYIVIPDSSSLKPKSAITLEAWIKPSQRNSWTKIISKDYRADGSWNNPYASYALAASNDNGKPYFDLTTNGVISSVIANTALENGKWYHVVGVYNGTNMSIYINGVLENTTAKSGDIDYHAQTSDISIGTRSPYTVSENFIGSIDEVNIYNRALTPAEILSRNSSLASITGSVLTLHMDKPAAANPLEIKDAITISAWIYPTEFSDSIKRIVTKGAREDYAIRMQGKRLWLYFNKESQYYITRSDTDIPANKWSHVVGVWNSTDQKPRIYVNGIETGYTGQDSLTGPLSSTGDLAVSSNGGEAFRGKIDELSIYNRSLSLDEIKNLYESGFNTVVNSVSGNNGKSPATLKSTDGKFNEALAFNRADNYIAVSHNNLDMTTDLSISLWVKLNQLKNQGFVMRSTNGYGLYMYASGKIGFGKIGVDEIQSNATLATDTWYYITAVHTGGVSKIYINGIEDNSGTKADFSVLNSDVFIAGHPNDAGWVINGSLDELNVFGRSLTQDEITALYTKGPSANVVGSVLAMHMDKSDLTTFVSQPTPSNPVLLLHFDDLPSYVSSNYTSWGSCEKNSTNFGQASGLEYDNTSDTLLVADTENSMIRRFDLNGNLLKTFPSSPRVADAYTPSVKKYVYILNTYDDDGRKWYVMKYDKNGNYLAKYDITDSITNRHQVLSLDQFDDGNFTVATGSLDYDWSQVVEFSENGTFIRRWDSGKVGSCGWACRIGSGAMRIIGNMIYEVRGENDYGLIYIWYPNGTLMRTLNTTSGSGINGDITMDSLGNFYAIQQGVWSGECQGTSSDYRIRKFSSAGTPLSKIYELPRGPCGRAGYNLATITILGDYLYLADENTGNITKMMLNGTIVSKTNIPTGIRDISSYDGSLYITDTSGYVRKYQSGGGSASDISYSSTFNIKDSYTANNVITPGSAGLYKVTATLLSDKSQILDQKVSVFSVSDKNISLILETDKQVYKPGEDVLVKATATNDGNYGQYTLSINKDSSKIYEKTATINKGDSYEYAISTKSNSTFSLTASIGGANYTTQIKIQNPAVSASINAPSIVNRSSFVVGVLLTNNANVSASETISIGLDSKSLVLLPSESTLVQFNLSITKDTLINITLSGDVSAQYQKSIVFGENVRINLTNQTFLSPGKKSIKFSAKNKGVLDSNVDIVFYAINDKNKQILAKSLFIPKDQTVDDEVAFDLLPGLYNITYQTDFETNSASILVASDPVFEITSAPQNIILEIGKDVSIPFTIKNTGASSGKTEIKLDPSGLIEDSNFSKSLFLAPGEEQSVIFTFSVPNDIEEKAYEMYYYFNNKKYILPYQLNGIKISASASLDKNVYQEGDIALLTFVVKNEKSNPIELFSRVKFTNYDQRIEYNLSAGETKTLTFNIPTNFSLDNKVFYSVYHKDGRSLYINTSYIHKKTGNITLYTDKQLYKTGESVRILVNTDKAINMTIQAPKFNKNEIINGAAEYQFDLLDKMTGTYYINYSDASDPSVIYYYPFDVDGFKTTVNEFTLNKYIFNAGENIVLNFVVDSTKAVNIAMNIDLLTSTDKSVLQFSKNLALVKGKNYIELSIPITSSVSGIHKIRYSLDTSLSGHSPVTLGQGESYLQVNLLPINITSYTPMIDTTAKEVILKMYTNRNATCRYSTTPNTPFEAMK